jgi:hypothetical protein
MQISVVFNCKKSLKRRSIVKIIPEALHRLSIYEQELVNVKIV